MLSDWSRIIKREGSLKEMLSIDNSRNIIKISKEVNLKMMIILVIRWVRMIK